MPGTCRRHRFGRHIHIDQFLFGRLLMLMQLLMLSNYKKLINRRHYASSFVFLENFLLLIFPHLVSWIAITCSNRMLLYCSLEIICSLRPLIIFNFYSYTVSAIIGFKKIDLDGGDLSTVIYSWFYVFSRQI